MKNCNFHPKYKVVLPPRSFCTPCWEMYLAKHGWEKSLKAYYSFAAKAIQEGTVNPKKLKKQLQKLTE